LVVGRDVVTGDIGVLFRGGLMTPWSRDRWHLMYTPDDMKDRRILKWGVEDIPDRVVGIFKLAKMFSTSLRYF
jgi:hypothetical protein